MEIDFVKLHEDVNFVSYRVNADIIEGPYTTEREKDFYLPKKMYAYFIFNKRTNGIEFNLQKSNAIFMANAVLKRLIFQELLRVKNDNEEYFIETSIDAFDDEDFE